VFQNSHLVKWIFFTLVYFLFKCFFQTREALTAEEIYNGCYVDIHDNNNEMHESLRNNLKVSFDGKRFSYKVISHLPFLWKMFVLHSA
jgi:TFIIE beta subunit core domain